jgi:GDPmannose 4,6-dehydratase
VKRALITGISGQDGSYLAELLLEKGYEVHGLVHGGTERRFDRLEPIIDRLTLYPGDLLDESSLVDVLRRAKPDEVYNLAAMSSVAQSWRLAVATAEYTAVGANEMSSSPACASLTSSSNAFFGTKVSSFVSPVSTFFSM